LTADGHSPAPGVRATGSLPALIRGGKITVKGGSGQVDPDGTLHSVGAGGGMTLTAVGRLLGTRVRNVQSVRRMRR